MTAVQLDEVARLMGRDPNQMRRVREAACRDALVHARADEDSATLFCGLPTTAPVQLDCDVFVTCPACLAEVLRRCEPSDDEVFYGLIEQRARLVGGVE